MTMNNDFPFSPTGGDSVSLAVTTSAQNVALPAITYVRNVRLAVNGTQPVFVHFSATATTSNGMLLLPGTAEAFAFQPGNVISAIASVAGSTLNVTLGDGS